MEDEIVQSKGLIKAIDKTSVHRLCSGQVVLTLATAVKELVENSLDAGATNITVRAVKSGLETIEVSDNGSGVEEDNFQALTLKHYTSKIAEFNDLVDIETYGFRGEALSSLCALSKVTIISRSSSSEVATKLSFDNGGKITSKSICPRQQGTTVIIEDIFSTLPVRRKELEKNISREFGRMVNYISSYCLIRLGLKLTITNLLKNNSTAVLRVTGNNSVKGNIMDVFGVKQWSTLVEFAACDRPDEDVLEELGISTSSDKISAFLQDLSVAGFVSSAEHGQGRSASDRQFFFINLRPFDSQKLARLINEVYHSFNRNQYPFVVLDIRIATSCIDVNVTPDKRQVFLQNEKLLLAIIKTSLKRMYSSTPSICKSISSTTTPSRPARDLNSEQNDRSQKKKRNFSVAFESKSPSSSSPSPSSSFLISSMKKQRTLDSFASTKSSSFASTKNHDDDNDVVIDKNDDRMIIKHNDDNNDRLCTMNCDKNTVITSNDNNNNNNDNDNCAKTFSLNAIISDKNDTNKTNDNNYDTKPVPKNSDVSKAISNVPKVSSIIGPQFSISSIQNPTSKSGMGSFQNDKPTTVTITTTTKKSVKNHRPRKNRNDNDDDGDDDDDDGDLELIQQRKTKTVNFSLAKLKEKLQNREYDKRNLSKTSKDVERKFKAQIQPSDNDKAESELQRMISKDMFQKMEVLGQFNLGFIISRLGSDLFIIDQHASDEKFNFERLERTVTLRNQKLIRPMRMELTACNESVLMENLGIFQKNGFEFAIDEEANLMDRIKLSSIPTSKNWTFGQQDVEEMIFMLTESPGVMCRPSRIRQMLASRACRSSVMIGTALNESEMKKLVKHMGEINQPWNCPHGRPTIRHLIDLNMIEP